MKRKKLIFMISSVLLLTTIVCLFIYYKPHRSVKNADASFSLTVAELVNAFTDNETKANAMYLDKILEVKGTLKEIIVSDSSLVLLLGDTTLHTGISCYLLKDQKDLYRTLKKGDTLRVKGICNGMLFDVVLDKCILLGV